MTTFSGPEGYSRARSLNNASEDLMVQVENRPYFPFLTVDPSDETNMIRAAKTVLNAYKGSTDNESHNNTQEAQIVRISGGLTNALFKIDFSFSSLSSAPQSAHNESILLRIFGAEGMIDRDLETATFARLCGAASDDLQNGSDASSKVMHPSLDLIGRFANGRVESWIPNMKQSTISDFASSSSIMNGLAQQLARLHHGFEVPAYLYQMACREVDGRRERVRVLKAGLWNVIYEWVGELDGAMERFDEDWMRLIYHAVMGKECSDSNVTLQMREEIVSHLQNETKWLQSMVEERHPNAIVAFTHNDLCTANILLHESTNNNLDDNSLCIIDYEYGSINYTMYDVANFFCELCGGNDDGIPNRELFPSEERQRAFLKEYIRERRKVLKANGEVDAVDENEDEVISELQSQIQLFQMASNLIWGVWGILQACGEVNHDTLHTRDAKLRLDGEIGLESFDNLRYGKNRLANYLFCKESMNVS